VFDQSFPSSPPFSRWLLAFRAQSLENGEDGDNDDREGAPGICGDVGGVGRYELYSDFCHCPLHLNY
jgi:hypothetical protein